jgi:hypothetical protein
LSDGVTAANASGMDLDGGRRQGASWLITSVPSTGCVALTLTFNNPSGKTVKYELTIQDNEGYSEAVASTKAFKALPPSGKGSISDFLRAQLIGGKVGEGSGLVPPPAAP